MPYFGNNPSPLLLNTVAQNGKEMTLDADADTSITADTDDQIDIKIGGADDFQFTANTFTAQSGSTIAAQALTATTITASGIVKTDDATDATSTTDGSLQTDGGLSVVKDAVFGDDVKLLSDASVIHFGADSEVTLTHVADTGLLMNDKLSISTADNDDQLELISTDADANGGPAVRFYRNSSSPADNDSLLTMRIEGNNDNSQVVVYNRLRADIIDASDGTEDSSFHIFNMMAGTERTMFSIKPDEVVLNEESQDVDFRVESDNLDDALFVEGSTGNLGVGISTPTSGYKMHLFNQSAGAGMLIQGLGAGIEAFLALQGETSGGSTRSAIIKVDNGDLIRFA